MKRILIAAATAMVCLAVAQAEDDWPFSSPSPASGSATPDGGAVDGMPIIKKAKGGRFKDGEIEAAIAAVKPEDYYEKDVPKVSLQNFKTEGPSLVGQVIKLTWSSREAALKEVTDGSSMPVVTLRQDVYSQRDNSFNFVYQDVKVPPDAMDFVKRLDVSKEVYWGQQPHVSVAYVLVLKGARPVFLGHEITEPTPMDPSKFVW